MRESNLHEVDRRRRVAELLRRELSTLLAREVDDRRVRMVSVTAVSVSKDLKQATVYVSSVEPSAAAAEIEATLNHAGKYLRYLLGKQIHLRVTPGLVFKYDHSIQRGMKMTSLLDSLGKGRVVS